MLSRHYLQNHRFMLTRISGELNDQSLMRHVIKLNGETEGVSDLRELADCRDMTTLEALTVRGTTDCAAFENSRPESLLAILIMDSTLHYGMARAYQIFSGEKRKAVEIFKDMHEALAWLANNDREIKILDNFVNACEIKRKDYGE